MFDKNVLLELSNAVGDFDLTRELLGAPFLLFDGEVVTIKGPPPTDINWGAPIFMGDRHFLVLGVLDDHSGYQVTEIEDPEAPRGEAPFLGKAPQLYLMPNLREQVAAYIHAISQDPGKYMREIEQKIRECGKQRSPEWTERVLGAVR